MRSARGLTLTALADATGLSTGLISQVERGLADPSLETLRRIAKVLEIPLFSLFRQEDIGTVAVVRENRRTQVKSPDHDIVYSRVSPGGGRLEVLHGTLGRTTRRLRSRGRTHPRSAWSSCPASSSWK
jgi:transcriptional regulator with XRE-family HTH domain